MKPVKTHRVIQLVGSFIGILGAILTIVAIILTISNIVNFDNSLVMLPPTIAFGIMGIVCFLAGIWLTRE